MKFWRMTGLIAASPVDIVLDKGNFTLEELLDEEEIIQEYTVRNSRLISYLRNRAQMEQLLHYLVEQAPEDAEEKQIFKFPFIACEIFICEVDVILNTLVENEELMDILFSFLKPDHPHNTLLAGYFSKVVICLMLRKTAYLMNYVKDHQEILRQLVDLIGTTSIMEVLIRLIGADENIYGNYVDEMQWLKDTDVLEMIVDKFSSSDSPQVHANAAEVLCAIIRYAPPGLAAKICSSSFMGRLFHHALEGSRPKSVLVHSLSVCISLLDPKRLVSASYNLFRSQLTHGSLVVADPETVDGMLESLGDLLKLLDASSAAIFFPTTYGYLKPPFGKHRLKIVEFVSVLLTIGSEAAERELIQQGAIKHILNMFIEYPFNNFLHRTVENMIGLCLESRSPVLIEHLFQDCDIVNKILGAEKQPLLSSDSSKPTIATRGRSPPRIGNLGHITRIANKLIRSANNNSLIQTQLQENKEWVVWHANVLQKRNVTENVSRWACGRPNALQYQLRDSDTDGFQDRAYDVVALSNNLNQAFGDESGEEAHVSLDPDNENIHFDNESAEAISSDHLTEDPDNLSLFTNSSGFSYEEDGVGKDPSEQCLSFPAQSSDQNGEVIICENDNIINSRISMQGSYSNTNAKEPGSMIVENCPIDGSEDTRPPSLLNCVESIEWRDSSNSNELPDADPIASSAVHEHKADDDKLVINKAVVADREDCDEHSCAMFPHAGPSTLDFTVLPTSDIRNQFAGQSEDSLYVNADLDAVQSTDEGADVVVTQVVSETAKQEQNSLENEGG